MKHPRSRTANRGYQLTAEAAAYLSENRPVSFTLTAKGINFVNDCKAPLGAIAEDENDRLQDDH